MIELKRNGSFAPSDRPVTGRIRVIGIGSGGINILDQMILQHLPVGPMLCLDTDKQALAGTVVAEHRLIGAGRMRGLGSGGDAELAAQAYRDEAAAVEELLRGTDTAVVVAALGGGTGTGLALPVLETLHKLGASVVFVGVTPLACEGPRRTALARTAAAQIRSRADAVLLFSNDRVLGLPEADADVRDGFRSLNVILAKAVHAIRSVLAQPGPARLGLTDFQQLVGRCEALDGELENCWVGLGTASGPAKSRDAVRQALAGPLFADGTCWKKGDRLLVTVAAGADLPLAEFHDMMALLKKELPVDVPVSAGAVVDPALGQTVSLGLFLARSGEQVVVTDETVVAAREQPAAANGELELDEPARRRPVRKPVKKQNYFQRQGELKLQGNELRGRFQRSTPTMRNGEDLDYPAFIRRGIKIRV
jgi:cell division protein FtsZ